ncbi:putative toxin-antitoxin system, toxin component [Streptomyces himastatinicus ATCC 53653]|uniref:Putative toxin-antitoxin system, toxin component n=1 Tax=Streptomyces himastatinicus ATCC 53653 TaxID=457427 RepID=D9WUC4_9ACTN|nr:DUF397 domain-containing protein [Streptomyces himastatinicus]EFL24359.1 putative toxin-antitoxin system, toxin component [Streptomyces himastatinicus ATCC 53653]
MTDIATLVWHKSSYSNGSGGNCVETAKLPDHDTAVRDSKRPDGPVLGFSHDAWGDFVTAVRRDELS